MSVNSPYSYDSANESYLKTFFMVRTGTIDFDTPSNRLSAALTGTGDRLGLMEFANLMQQISGTIERGTRESNLVPSTDNGRINDNLSDSTISDKSDGRQDSDRNGVSVAASKGTVLVYTLVTRMSSSTAVSIRETGDATIQRDVDIVTFTSVPAL